ncbi:hypothetical protein BZA77DRAFT_298331 [Pyronema omphalodes]|nr:hypothetical protein BZA77DRAFT_298331 [Pyronema omphalodes]
MSGKTELLHLPAELLHEIVKYRSTLIFPPCEQLNPRDCSVLRQTCWTTRQLVLADAFRIVKLNFTSSQRIQRQLQCLAAENGISRTAVKAYTRELHVIAGSWYTKSHDSLSERRTQASLHGTSPQNGTVFSPAQALSAFQGIESVEACRIINCDVRSGTYDALVPVLEYLASLKTLHNVYIGLANILGGSLSQHGPLYQRDFAITTDLSIENRFLGLLGATSGITRLTLDGQAFRYHCLPELGWFFRNLVPLKLHALALDGLYIDAAGVEALLPNLAHLRELTIQVNVQNTEILWQALETAKIKLQVLDAKGQASPQLLQYLTSFSGLQKLSMSHGYDSEECSSTEITVAIQTHARSLRELYILDKDLEWVYGDEISDALRQCIILQTLVVAVTRERSLELFHLASSLPSLEILKFEPVDYGITCEEAQLMMSFRMDLFRIPDGSRLRVIDFYCPLLWRLLAAK